MDERETDNDAGSSSDGEADGEADAEAGVFPVIVRRFEPVPDLDDRLRSIYALLSLPPFPFE